MNISTAGKDYDGQSQLVTLAASTGPSETCFNITIIDDENLERTEEFCVNFQIPFGSSARAGDITSTCITIIDNDQGTYIANCTKNLNAFILFGHAVYSYLT